MSSEQGFWQGLPQRSKKGLIAGLMVIVACTCAAAWWLLRVDYQVLFSDLKPQDAQAMLTELDRLKIPYRLADGGNAILVDNEVVHATRLKLMGQDIPLHGAVGLELFNNTDFGMTEFAQKINYQRALQGEITRTIQSLSEIRDVRVMLALPEQGLFKQAESKAKASITLSLKPGRSLSGEQVNGIQRLVSASVPGLTMQDVTIVDGQGVALTRSDDGDEAGAVGTAVRLDLKRDMERYLGQKVSAVLDEAFGHGQALASVDVTLNMDRVRTTTEDVLPATARAGMQATGVVVHEREVLQDSGRASDVRTPETGTRGNSSQRDIEYSVGRRVEQVVSQPGSIRRLHVAAILRAKLDASQEDRLRKVLAAAAGAVLERGDTVVIHSLASVGADNSIGPHKVEDGGTPANGLATLVGAPNERRATWLDEQLPWLAAALGLLLLTVMGVAIYRNRFGAVAGRGAVAVRQQLSEAERVAAMQRVHGWLNNGASEASPSMRDAYDGVRRQTGG